MDASKVDQLEIHLEIRLVDRMETWWVDLLEIQLADQMESLKVDW